MHFTIGLAVISALFMQAQALLFNQTALFNQTLAAAVGATAKAKTCNDCYNILNILKPVAQLGDVAFAELSVAYCNTLHQYTPDVCQGLHNLFHSTDHLTPNTTSNPSI